MKRELITYLSVVEEYVKGKDADLYFYILGFDILAFPCHQLLERQNFLFDKIPCHSLTIQHETFGLLLNPCV